MAGVRYSLLIVCALVATIYRPAMCGPPSTHPISASDAFADSTRVAGAIRGAYGNMNVVPPCHVPSIDTTGWQTIRHGGSFTYKLPPTFQRDARFKHGRIAWIDGRRSFAEIPIAGCYGCAMDYTPGCSECVDTLAATPFRLVTTFARWDSLYYVVASSPPETSSTGWYHELRGASPDSLDQRLFLAIFRTLQRDTTSH